MEVIFYTFMFCLGTLFGSFSTLAVYRIPLHQDITHKRSYCPNCKHKLSFWDMIPILSYVFLGGKCRYCGKKIKMRYLLLEVFTGLIFLLFAVSLNLSMYTLTINQIVYLIISILYLVGIIIIAGIDKERIIIQKGLLLYETILISICIVYLCIVENTNIYRYAIYLLALAILVALENIYIKKTKKDNYTLQILELSIIMILFGGGKTYVLTTILTLIIIIIKGIKNLIKKNNKCNEKNNELYYNKFPIGFYLICCNIISIIILNFVSI